MPGTFQTPFGIHAAFPKRSEEMAAAVGHCERLAAADTDRESTVRGVLDDRDLGLAELVQSDEPGI
jgi:hypothetical protein